MMPASPARDLLPSWQEAQLPVASYLSTPLECTSPDLVLPVAAALSSQAAGITRMLPVGAGTQVRGIKVEGQGAELGCPDSCAVPTKVRWLLAILILLISMGDSSLFSLSSLWLSQANQ